MEEILDALERRSVESVTVTSERGGLVCAYLSS